MHIWKRISLGLAMAATVLVTTGCGTVSTIGKLEDGAAGEAGRMWDRWVDGNGDIAVAITAHNTKGYEGSFRMLGELADGLAAMRGDLPTARC